MRTKFAHRLEAQGSIFQTNSDTEVIVHLIALSNEQTLPDAMADALRRVEGAFSLVMLSSDRIFAARDPRGFRPLAMGRIPRLEGQRQDTIVFASETCAFDLIGATYEREVKPGELVIVGPEGITSRFYSPRSSRSRAAFSSTCISRGPTAWSSGAPVQAEPRRPGTPAGAGSSGRRRHRGSRARLRRDRRHGLRAESGIPFRFGLIRNHYVGRTFIEPEQSVRDFGVKLKLNPVRTLLEGKRVVLIDDSIVRGTTSRKIVRMIRNAGAKEVHMRISCPPTISPCFYGVDTPSKKQLIAANKSVEEIREYIGADSLAYLSLEGLKKACGEGEKTTYCTACYTGNYPTKWWMWKKFCPPRSASPSTLQSGIPETLSSRRSEAQASAVEGSLRFSPATYSPGELRSPARTRASGPTWFVLIPPVESPADLS